MKTTLFIAFLLLLGFLFVPIGTDPICDTPNLCKSKKVSYGYILLWKYRYKKMQKEPIQEPPCPPGYYLDIIENKTKCVQ